MTRNPTYIERIAQDVYETAEATGQPYPADEASLWLGYAVLVLAKGTGTTSADVHDAWSAWATVTHNGDHRSLIPFDDLTPEIQAFDDRYRDAIHAVAKRRIAAAGPAYPSHGDVLTSPGAAARRSCPSQLLT
jgi:hypothetical protein